MCILTLQILFTNDEDTVMHAGALAGWWEPSYESRSRTYGSSGYSEGSHYRGWAYNLSAFLLGKEMGSVYYYSVKGYF